MDELPFSELGTACEIVGRGITPSYDLDGEVLVLNQKCVRDGRVNIDVARRHTGRAVPPEKLLRGGEVLVNSTGTGTLGRTAYFPGIEGPVTVDSHVTIIRSGENHPEWLRYAIRQIEPQIEALAEGSTGQTELNRALLSSIAIQVPSLAEQRAIAGVLGALDDKVDSNRRSGSLIESIVPLIFGKYCGAAPADLFLSDIADFQKGVSYRSVDLQDSSAAMVTLKSFDRNGGYKSEGLKPYVGKFKDSQVIGNGEFAVAQTDLTQGAEVVGRVVRIPRDSRFETLIASLDLIIVRPRDNINSTYLYGVLLDPRFREHCRARTSGTTVLHLGSDALPNYPIPATSEADQLAFAKAAEPLLKRQDQLERESASLAKLRDTLLPELLSGRIRVRDAESIVEDAL